MSKFLIYFVLISVLLSSIVALPPKGCTSCLMAPIESSTKSGISSANKTMNSEGCFVQTVQCAAKSDDSETYIQFNGGRKGLFAAVEQTIQLFCNREGKWEFRHSSLVLVVNMLTCLST